MSEINWIHNIPFFCIFIAMFSSIITALIKNGRVAHKIHLGMVLIVGILSGVLLYKTVVNQETFFYMMGHYPAPWGNELRGGPLEALMSTGFSIVMFLTFLGGGEFIFKEVSEQKQNIYFVMLNALFGSILALIYTNDIFTAYVFIEINTIASCAIVAARGTRESMVGTIQYLVISLVGSGLFLLSVCILYSITGHLLFPQMKEAIVELMETGQYELPFLVVTALMFIGIAIKSALFPFYMWVSEFYPVASAPSSAILSGLVSKSYIFLGIKLIFCVFSIEVMRSLKIIDVLFAFGLGGMVMGSLHAMREGKMRRMLAYSSAAQIGYIYMGIGLGSEVGMTAACFHILAHAFGKSMLFLCCGRFVEVCENKEKIYYMRGVALRNPIAGLGYTIGGLSMIGIPLFAGFTSKIYFASASMYEPTKMIAVLLVLGISMILNALYFLPSMIAIWSPSKEHKGKGKIAKIHHNKRAHLFDFSIVILIIFNIIFGIYI